MTFSKKSYLINFTSDHFYQYQSKKTGLQVPRVYWFEVKGHKC